MKKAILLRIASNNISFAKIPSFLNTDLDIIFAYIQSKCLKLTDLTNSNLLAQHTPLTRVISLLTEKAIIHEKKTLNFQDILNIIITIRSEFLIEKLRTIIAYYRINTQEKRRIPTQIINSICQEIRIEPEQLEPDDLTSLAQFLGRTTSLFTNQSSKHYQKLWFWQHNIDLICKILPFNPNSYADLGWRE